MSKSKLFFSWILAGCCLAITAAAIAEDSIIVDANGDYIITYRSNMVAGGIARVVWVPSTKIDPLVMWNIGLSDSHPEELAYRYTFKNGKTSRQDLEGGRLVVSHLIPSSQIIPAGWQGTVSNSLGGNPGFVVGWSFGGAKMGGVKPGARQGGFGLKSNHLPGIGLFEFWGSAPAGQSFPDEGPDELSPIRTQFVDLSVKDFISRNTAVPRISVSNPFNAAVALDNLRAHITGDIVGIKLIDPIFASQLDRLIQAAANSVRLNNPQAAREQIKDALKLLRKEHEDMDKDDGDRDEGKDDKDRDDKKSKSALIDRLAARVLDFDLRYVERRLKTKDDNDRDDKDRHNKDDKDKR